MLLAESFFLWRRGDTWKILIANALRVRTGTSHVGLVVDSDIFILHIFSY